MISYQKPSRASQSMRTLDSNFFNKSTSTHILAILGLENSAVAASKVRGFPKIKPIEKRPRLLNKKIGRLGSDTHIGAIEDSASRRKSGLHRNVRMGYPSKNHVSRSHKRLKSLSSNNRI